MDIEARVRGFITENFYVPDASSLAADASLVEQGVVDSTGVLEIVTFLEQSFELHVEDAEMLPENLDSIAGIVRFVETKKKRAA